MNGRGQTTISEARAIKAAFRELVDQAGGAVAAAKLCRVQQSRISNYCSPNDPSFPPADVIADLERAVGEALVTAVMAEVQHHSIIPLAAVEAPERTVEQCLGPMTEHCGRVLVQIGAALAADGCSPAEARDARPTVKALIAQLQALDASLERIELSEIRPAVVRRL